MMIYEEIKKLFLEEFQQEPMLVRSSGRVNLIGEHVDYNGGFVLPAAIDKSAYVAIAPAESQIGKWISMDLKKKTEVDFGVFKPLADHRWANYILGVVEQFAKRGLSVKPFHCVMSGDVPIGSGLSSSAALESAIAFGINEMNNLGLDRTALAQLVQQAENEFIGVKCGIMDMFASLRGKENHVLRLDCETLDYQYFPLSLGDCKIVLFDTGVKHNLVDSEYNVRRSQCEEGLAFFRKKFDNAVQNLSQVPLAWLQASRSQLNPVVYNRCQYVIEENQRILSACEDLQAGRLEDFGIKMTATHEGLRHLYEVSCQELDFLVDELWHESAVLGSRMMGGGFGGCTINIIKMEAIDGLFAKLSTRYEQKMGKKLKMYSVVTANGTEIING
ncbi:MAG: galactokinase [Arcicella sp.]|jgi:galactokinase|nr:galactokinase [Arcicella sp.]